MLKQRIKVTRVRFGSFGGFAKGRRERRAFLKTMQWIFFAAPLQCPAGQLANGQRRLFGVALILCTYFG
jgi:hypothetical protein